MPSKASSRNGSSSSSGEIEHGSEFRRPARQHQKSRFATEKPVSQRTNQELKLKEKAVKVEKSFRLPHSDVPFEFVKNEDGRFIVQSKSSGSTEDELVKYMSKVPSFLQRGENPQDNALNFGVLDWGRLEQWKHKREGVVVSEKFSGPSSGSCSSSSGYLSAVSKTEALACSSEQHNISTISNSAPKVDSSPVVLPLSGRAIVSGDLQTSENNFVVHKETHKKDTSRRRGSVRTKSSRFKERHLGHESSNCDREGSRTLNNSDGEERNCAQAFDGLKIDNRDQYCSGKQEGIVLLLPKDFSSSGSSKAHRSSSLDAKAAEFNWGSFSDIFSVDEIQPQESSSDIPHSCPLKSGLEIENELDMKLDTLIKSQGAEIPVNPSKVPSDNAESKVAVESSSSMTSKASMDRKVQRFSDEIGGDSSIHCRITSSLARLTRSLSFRESSVQPPSRSTYVSAKSGPAKPEACSTNSEFRNSSKASIQGRAKVSPLRRLLDPIFKSKVAEQSGEKTNDLIVNPMPIVMNEEHEPSTVKALLHLTVKSGLPLFKFVVGRNDEIFASTVKSLSSLDKDDMSWLYTFYSVQKIRKHSSSWKRNHQKVKPCGLGYNVVGQMKVSEPYFPSWCEQKSRETPKVKEFVLYSVDVGKGDESNFEFKASKELAAIVVNMPDASLECSSFYADNNLNDSFTDSEQNKLGRIVVVLPGAEHSLPQDGVPSSLIARWRNGGSCDCGGWDIGCKLRILSEKWQKHKYLQVHCDLYDQGEAKQCSPFFSLIPLRDGLFSVEYDVRISSLQAFSISFALINSHSTAYSTDADESKEELGSAKASMRTNSEGPEIHVRHPPLSPVDRV